MGTLTLHYLHFQKEAERGEEGGREGEGGEREACATHLEEGGGGRQAGWQAACGGGTQEQTGSVPFLHTSAWPALLCISLPHAHTCPVFLMLTSLAYTHTVAVEMLQFRAVMSQGCGEGEA